MISWVQGPPGTDSRSIARQAKEIRRLEGNLRYIALRLYAAYRTRIGRPPFAHTDIAICGSQWAAEDLAKHVGPGVQIKTLPYPVDLNTFCPPAHAETQTEPVVLWAGRTVPRKRLDLFLDACDRLIANGSPIQVRVVGGFEFTPGYKKFLSDFRYRDRLHYDAAVPRSTMPDEYRRAAVLVQTSEDENFGSAVAEGLACSTPVVLGPTNGTGDYMEDGGIRFERYDSEAVAIAISKALYNNCTLANFARKAAEKNFHPTQIAGRLEEILFSAIGRTSDVDH